jgi:hypothetical protein
VDGAPGETHALHAVISARSNGDPSVGPTLL